MEKIVDNIGYALKDAADPASFKDEFMRAQKKFMEKLPTPEHFMQLIDSLKDITEEEKEKLKKNFAERAMNAEKFKELFTGKKSSVLPFIGSGYQEYVIFVGMVLLIVIVIGFFGYKLYLSIMAKEMKREKKTRKQLKEEKKTQSPPSSPRSKKEM